MKPYIYIAGLSCLSLASVTVNAKEEDTKPRSITRKFAIGLNAGLTSSGGYCYSSGRNFVGSIPGTTTGLFARYYMGPHFAIEAGADIGRAERNYKFLKEHELSVSVPINFQYYLLPSQARLRPYFGMGVGYKGPSQILNSILYLMNSLVKVTLLRMKYICSLRKD